MTVWIVFLHPTNMNGGTLHASIECSANGNVEAHILELWTEASELHQSKRMAYKPSTKSANSRVAKSLLGPARLGWQICSAANNL